MALVDEKQDTLIELKSSTVISIRNVLFATDFSATSESALPYAAAICRRFGGTLHAVHVVSDASLLMMTGGVDYVSMTTVCDDALTEAKQQLELTTARLEGIPHHNYVRHGQVWNNLAGIIADNAIDLIVVGTHGRTGIGKLVLGSVAEDILRHAPCPVLTIGPKVSGRAKLPAFHDNARDLAPPELDLRHVLFATNFAHNSALGAYTAVALAEEFRARLTLLHVLEDYTQLGGEPGPIEDGVRQLRDLIPMNATLQYAPDTVIEFGHPSERILKVAASEDADLIVLGARAVTDVGTTHLPWSTAHHVIAKAHCPVLTIRE